MKTLTVSLSVFSALASLNPVFFKKRTDFIDGENVYLVFMCRAKLIGNDLVLYTCDAKKQDVSFTLKNENECNSEDDAIAMALNGV